MDISTQSLVRGTTAQASKNPNKAKFLAEKLTELNVASLKELDYQQNMLINVAMAGIDSTQTPINTNSDWIGQAINAERAKGKNSGFD